MKKTFFYISSLLLVAAILISPLITQAATLTTILVSPLSANLTAGGAKQQLQTLTLDQNNSTMTATITWTSSNPSVATVSTTGLVTPVTAGTTNITASSGGVVGRSPFIATVSQSAPVVDWLVISPDDPIFLATKGAFLRLTTIAYDTNNNIISATPTWKSSNTSVATVDSSTGLVKAISSGWAQITASAGSHSYSAAVKVGPGTPSWASQTKTSIVPTPGNYSFSSSISSYPSPTFSVFGAPGSKTRSVTFSADGWAHYTMSVNDGEFHFQNGYVGRNEDSSSGNVCPTDGFRISGHFTSPTSASGTISDVGCPGVYSTKSFTATIQ